MLLYMLLVVSECAELLVEEAAAEAEVCAALLLVLVSLLVVDDCVLDFAVCACAFIARLRTSALRTMLRHCK